MKLSRSSEPSARLHDVTRVDARRFDRQSVGLAPGGCVFTRVQSEAPESRRPKRLQPSQGSARSAFGSEQWRRLGGPHARIPATAFACPELALRVRRPQLNLMAAPYLVA